MSSDDEIPDIPYCTIRAKEKHTDGGNHSSHFKGGVRNYWQSQQGTIVIVNGRNITDYGINTLRIKNIFSSG